MNTAMNGKRIRTVYWPDTDTERGRRLDIRAGCGELYLSATYHGDHDQFWIVQERDGKEVARHNLRHVETIVWLDEAQS